MAPAYPKSKEPSRLFRWVSPLRRGFFLRLKAMIWTLFYILHFPVSCCVVALNNYLITTFHPELFLKFFSSVITTMLCCILMQKLVINPGKMDIDAFESDDFEIQQYFPHKKIAMQMAV